MKLKRDDNEEVIDDDNKGKEQEANGELNGNDKE